MYYIRFELGMPDGQKTCVCTSSSDFNQIAFSFKAFHETGEKLSGVGVIRSYDLTLSVVPNFGESLI